MARSSALLAFISIRVDVDEPTPVGLTPLTIAAGYGRVRVARVLLKTGADLSATGIQSGATALHASARQGHMTVTRLLVKAGADLDARNSNGVTPLFLAACMGHVEVMGELIGARANVNSCMDGGATWTWGYGQDAPSCGGERTAGTFESIR